MIIEKSLTMILNNTSMSDFRTTRFCMDNRNLQLPEEKTLQLAMSLDQTKGSSCRNSGAATLLPIFFT